MIVNGVGAAITGIVAAVFAVTKFAGGAWVVLIVVPALVTAFYAVHCQYRALAAQLSVENGRRLTETAQWRRVRCSRVGACGGPSQSAGQRCPESTCGPRSRGTAELLGAT
jgi:hypothetical protein